MQELDFTREAANAQRFAGANGAEPCVWVPRVFGALSSGRVLTMEHSTGTRSTRGIRPNRTRGEASPRT